MACSRCLSRRPSPWTMYRSSAGLPLSARLLLGCRRGSSDAAMQSAPAHPQDVTQKFAQRSPGALIMLQHRKTRTNSSTSVHRALIIIVHLLKA